MNNEIYTHAELNYAGEDDLVTQITPINNARLCNRSFSWRSNGFELINCPSQVSNWYNEQQINDIYYREIQHLSHDLTGADAIIFYPAIIRSQTTAQTNPDYTPIQFVHSDYTESYQQMIADSQHPYFDVLRPSMQQQGISLERIKQASRVVTLQFWRNIGAATPDYPLAFCDSSSVPRSHLQPFKVENYGDRETQFEIFAATAPTKSSPYQWYTYPNMLNHELMVFRAFDSDAVKAKTPFWTLHSAFLDSHANPGDHRESIEMRAICLFD